MGSSSVPTSIVNLMKSVIGSGILCVPFAFAQTGVLLGVVLLLFCGVATAFAFHLLALCVIQAHGRGQDVTYQALSQVAFRGRQAPGVWISLCVILCSFGICVSYFIVIGDLLPEAVEFLGARGSWNSRALWITFIGWCIELPLCFLPNVDSLKVSSMIGTGGIVYIVIVLCILASGSVTLPSSDQPVSFWLPPSSKHTSMLGMVESLPIFIFAFNCAMNVPPVLVELKEPTIGRANAVIYSPLSISFVVYLVVGISGTLAFGASVEGNSLKAFPNEQGTTGGRLSIFARLAIVINVMGSIPLFVHGMRGSVSQLLFRKAQSELGFEVRSCVTFLIFVPSWCAALAVTSLDEVMALVGSTGLMIIGSTLPGLFYIYGVRSQREEPFSESNFGIAMPDQKPAGSENVSPGSQQPMRIAAWLMVVVSLLLIPFLLGAEIYKMLHHH